MTDKLTPSQRSKNMSAVRGKDTLPEIYVRRKLHSMGYRFRLHRKDLPGKPDIVLPKHKLCIFVNGCFWHQHQGCKRATRPKTNSEFWDRKLTGNVKRDEENYKALQYLGWTVAVIWECECKTNEGLDKVIAEIQGK